MASSETSEKLAIYTPKAELVQRIDSIVPRRPVDNLDNLTTALETLRREDLAFVLTPIARVDHIQAFHQISLRTVWIDPTVLWQQKGDRGFWKAGPHCYRNPSFMGLDEVALTKNGLAAILAGAGASPITQRLDDGTRLHYAAFGAVVYNRDYDGEIRQYPGYKAVDLTDRSAAAMAMQPKQLEQARQFIVENAETKAILRGLRPLFSLQQAYKVADLQRKPFVIPKLVKHWDLSDPDQKRAAISEALGHENRLFGPGQATRGMVQVPELPAKDTPALAAGEPPAEQSAAAASTATPSAGPTTETPEAFDLDDVPDSFDKPSRVVCTCACGHEREVTPETAEETKKRTGGVPRCSECFPGKAFNFELHKTLNRLGMPRWEALTAEEIRNHWQAAPKKAGRA